MTNLRGKHKQIYNLAAKEVDPQVNWEALVEEKLDKLSSQSFGTDLPLVDHQVEQHNIFHNEVKAIGPLLAKDGAKVGTVAEGTGDGGGHMCTAALTRALGSVPRNRTANSRPSTRNCWQRRRRGSST